MNDVDATSADKRSGAGSIMSGTAKRARGTRFVLSVLAALGPLMWLVAVPTTASATTPDVSQLQQFATGQCLTENTDRKGGAYTFYCFRKGSPQSWVHPVPGATGTIQNTTTGKCLDSNPNGDVYMLPCNGGNYQKWTFGPGARIRDLATGRCLDGHKSDLGTGGTRRFMQNPP